MPTYDYTCQSCDRTFEIFQKVSEGLKRKCPECGQLKLRREIGAGAGLIFRGSGFYVTDYKRNGSASTSKSGSGESSTASRSEGEKNSREGAASNGSTGSKEGEGASARRSHSCGGGCSCG